ncbi:M48 family metallopeptidase [Robbsia sp. Bb-Pol-6]|uniref:M48 family metallopeptidase n=1 Tax=Robbsia betulipollinis TaxID=2981849 RepID=A0ABT3ZK29_9BURK|nr:M48 family metallopeptidase [Robbsia betulipollinis]MCY0386901.1 M48 family metallopeptidase [Robbsia betulipollinis]
MTLPGRPRPATRAIAALRPWALALTLTAASAAAPATGSPAASVTANKPPPSAAALPSPAPASPQQAGAEDPPAPAPDMFRSMVPSAWLETQGAQAYAQVMGAATRAHRLEPAGNARVVQAREILQRLVPYALKWNDRARNWKWEVNLVRSRDINAICLPGGRIAIDTGMLERLKLNNDETALLMSHLIAHALREHARAHIGEQQTTAHDDGASSGRADTVTEQWSTADVAAQLIAMRYGTSDETEADVIGADIASRAGFDPRAGLVLWQKFDWAARRRRQPFTFAHPVNAKRLADLKKRQKDMLPLYAKAKKTTVGRLPPYRPGR